MGRCPTPRKGEAGLRSAPVVAKPTSTGRRATLTCLKTRFARFSVQGRPPLVGISFGCDINMQKNRMKVTSCG